MLKLQHRKYPLRCVAFSADGQLLAACGVGGTVQVWDLYSRRLAHYFNLIPTTIEFAFFSHEGAHLFALDWTTFYSIDLATGQPTVLGPAVHRTFFPVAASADRRRACLGWRDYRGSVSFGVTQYDLAEWKPLWDVKGPFGAVPAYSADGRFFACAGRSWRKGGPEDVTILHADTGAVRQVLRNRRTVQALAISPEGGRIAWAAPGLCFWRLDPPRLVRTHESSRTAYHSLAWHPSGEFFATAKGDGSIDYWDGHTGERRHGFDWGVGKVNDVVFDDAGDRGACCSQSGAVVVWDVDR
jgi:WD40 repeat protein